MWNKLTCDKLCFTGRFQTMYKLQEFKELVNAHFAVDRFGVVSIGRGRYKYQVFIKQVTENSFLQFGGDGDFVLSWRYEFNPNKSGREVEWVLKKLVERSKVQLKLGQSFNVTRIDLAIDLPYDISGLKIKYAGTQKTAKYFGRDGSLETYYVGVGECDRRIRIYNKAREQKVNFAWTRVEAQVRDVGRLHNLTYIYPFKDLEVYWCGNSLEFGYVSEEVIPLQYQALLYFFQDFPEQKGKLKRHMRQELAKYENACYDVGEKLDLRAINDNDVWRVFDHWRYKMGLGGEMNDNLDGGGDFCIDGNVFYVEVGWEDSVFSNRSGNVEGVAGGANK